MRMQHAAAGCIQQQQVVLMQARSNKLHAPVASIHTAGVLWCHIRGDLLHRAVIEL